MGFGRAGGGVLSFGTATIRDSVIANNRCTGEGGGIVNALNMTIVNSAITNNRTLDNGGGISTAIGNLYLINSTVSGNIADLGGGSGDTRGGGIYYSPGFTLMGSVTLTNSTVANNQATGLGGGLRIDDTLTASISNSLIAGNVVNAVASDVSGAVTSGGFNLVRATGGSTGWLATDLLNIDPLLGPLGNNGGSTFTHAVLPGSPAINAGNNDLAVDPVTHKPLLFDQRGYARITAGAVDIGAYETNYSMFPVTVGGRVTTSGGRGIAGVRIMFTAGGTTLYSQTNPFGYYRFAGLTPGTTYTVALMHKYYQFDPPLVVTVDQNRSDLNFVAR
jgi:hypothetical protein